MLLKAAQAGTLESNDILVAVMPGEKGAGIVIELKSIVLAQYGDSIRSVIRSACLDRKAEDVLIKANDRGALDCTIRARTEAALLRAIQKEAAL